MSCMVWMPAENRRRAIELLGEDEPGQSVGQREGSKREKQRGARARGFRPAARRADGEGDVLDASLTLPANPCSEGLGAHLFPAAVEEDELGRGTSALPLEPGKQGLLALECLIAAAQSVCAAFKISQSRSLKGIARGEPGTDVRHGDIHGEEDKLAGFSAICN
jgi:hypothetical protein